MGKILKYCSSCEEGFAERFTFCPDCGASLQAYEMNPVTGESKAIDEGPATSEITEPAVFDTLPAAEIPAVEEAPAQFETAAIEETAPLEDDVQEIEVEAAADHDEEFEEDEIEYDDEPVTIATSEPLYQAAPVYADGPRSYQPTEDDEAYHVTEIQDNNAQQRHVLLLGATALVLTLAVGAWGVSLFQKSLDIGAIGDEGSLATLIDDVPMPVEEEIKPEKKDKGGGGGGGGREEEREVAQGDLADQTKDPIRPPDAHVPKLTQPELVLPPPSTQGNMKFEKKYQVWGDPNSLSTIASNGMGSGGGMGSGRGTGQGSGNGSGAGSGSGSGYGNGIGNGNGNGVGDGDGSGGPPPPVRVGVTSPVKIISKPKAMYTDDARTAQVQGVVRLKVTFLASGQIGSITPLNRLPHGLTEQAIAAARQIRFEPAKVNGVPVSKIMTAEYGFNIY
jgi:TonB family protein